MWTGRHVMMMMMMMIMTISLIGQEEDDPRMGGQWR